MLFIRSSLNFYYQGITSGASSHGEFLYGSIVAIKTATTLGLSPLSKRPSPKATVFSLGHVNWSVVYPTLFFLITPCLTTNSVFLCAQMRLHDNPALRIFDVVDVLVRVDSAWGPVSSVRAVSSEKPSPFVLAMSTRV